jgi:endonuclease I
MRETYELEFPDDLSMLLDEWDDVDPISPAEVDRNERILDVQGTANGFVSP